METHSHQPDVSAMSSGNPARPAHRRARRPPQPGGSNPTGSAGEQDQPTSATQRPQRRFTKEPHRGDGASERVRLPDAQSSVANTTAGHSHEDGRQPKRRPPRPRPPRPQTDNVAVTGSGESSLATGPAKRFGRAPRFNGGLSADKPHSTSRPKEQKKPSARKQDYAQPKKDDLTSTLTHDLSTPPYPDCVICFSAVRPFEPTYSCSPNTSIAAAATDSDGESKAENAVTAQCCWTTFHLKCIKAWASKSVKDTEQAWRARGEERQGVWRCPGCQSQRSVVPSVYRYAPEGFCR